MMPLHDLIAIHARRSAILEAYEQTNPPTWYQMRNIYTDEERVWWQVRQTILESMR